MNTIDDLLRLIASTLTTTVGQGMPLRDVKALKNIAKLVDDPKYITENQANLVVKILKENVELLENFREDVEALTASPNWARTFRVIQHVRKLYITTDYDLPQIAIETTFSSELQKELMKFPKAIEGFANAGNGKLYIAALTEKNIVEIIDRLKKFKFSVSDDLKEYYSTIKSWSKSDIVEQYRITTISYPNFEKHIIADLGIDTSIGTAIIADRSIRYRYYVEKHKNYPKTLAEMLANRETTKIWVDNSVFSFSNLIESFIVLKRLPTLIVLDSRDEQKCLEDLKKISESLEEQGIFDGIGVYFRLDNNAAGKEFNQFIAEKKYNSRLDHTSKVAIVQSGKIPKFLLKTDWKPMSVVSVNHPLRHSKTAIYANCCDLVVTYTDTQPLIESRNPWE